MIQGTRPRGHGLVRFHRQLGRSHCWYGPGGSAPGTGRALGIWPARTRSSNWPGSAASDQMPPLAHSTRVTSTLRSGCWKQACGIVLIYAFSNSSVMLGEAIPKPEEISTTTLAQAGTVAMINVSQFRSDALLITSEGILVQPLPHLSPSTVRDVVEGFLVALETRNLPHATTGGDQRGRGGAP